MTAGPSPTLSRDELPAERHHFVALDGLRAFAIVQVMLNHYVQHTRPNASMPVVVASNFFQFFGNGVHLFFVISGFLITGILLRARGSPSYFRTFYARRTLRIFPLYYGVLFATFGGLALYRLAGHSLSQEASEASRQQWWLWAYLTNFSEGFGLRGSEFGGFSFGHFWTLAVEEQFYLVWPLLVLLAGRVWLSRICIAGCLALLAARMILRSDAHENLRFYLLSNDGLFIGSWLAAKTTVRKPSRALARRCVVIFAISAAAFLCMTTMKFALQAHHLPARAARALDVAWPALNTIQGIMFAALVYLTVVAAEASTFRRVLQTRAIVYIGKISYGIYVYHLLLIGAFVWIAAQIVPRFSTNSIWVWSATVCVMALLAVGTATLSWTFYEQPILRLKKYFSYSGPRLKTAAE